MFWFRLGAWGSQRLSVRRWYGSSYKYFVRIMCGSSLRNRHFLRDCCPDEMWPRSHAHHFVAWPWAHHSTTQKALAGHLWRNTIKGVSVIWCIFRVAIVLKPHSIIMLVTLKLWVLAHVSRGLCLYWHPLFWIAPRFHVICPSAHSYLWPLRMRRMIILSEWSYILICPLLHGVDKALAFLKSLAPSPITFPA